MKLLLEVPCCQVCSDWMHPVLLVEHPVPAAVWCCENHCSTLMHGFTLDGEIPSVHAQYAFAVIANGILEGATP